MNWELQRKVALIPDKIWQKGHGAVAEEIARIETRLALALTDNAEQIVVNPDTGLAMLVGDSDLPDDIGTYARRKMGRALAIFPQHGDNQYIPLRPALEVVQAALDDPENLPVELYDTCASASRMVATLERTEAIPAPATDARLDEFVTLIRETGADILAHDAKTRDVLERRQALTGNRALIEAGEVINIVAQELAEASEGPLARAMPRDAAIATDPNADPEERKQSAFKLIGRVLRFPRIVGGAFLVSGAAIAAVKEHHWLGAKIIASAQFQNVWQAILRYLGFG